MWNHVVFFVILMWHHIGFFSFFWVNTHKFECKNYQNCPNCIFILSPIRLDNLVMLSHLLSSLQDNQTKKHKIPINWLMAQQNFHVLILSGLNSQEISLKCFNFYFCQIFVPFLLKIMKTQCGFSLFLQKPRGATQCLPYLNA